MRKPSTWLYLFLLLGIASVTLIYHLNQDPLHVWDESNNAVNAWEMSQSGNLIYRTALGKPDFWDTKPPLFIWTQALMMKFIGPDVLAVRLPATFFALGTALLLFFFGLRELKSALSGFCAAAVLLFSPGFTGHHIARTGDNDAALIFFLTLALLQFHKWVHTWERRHLWTFSTALFAAFLTKGIAGFFFLPGMLVFAFLSGKAALMLRRPDFYIAGFTVMLLSAGYYALHEWLTPGYLHAMFYGEFLRPGEPADYGQYPFSFFIELWRSRFVPWVWALPLALLYFTSRKPAAREKSIALLSAVTALILLLALTVKRSHTWYDGPVFPLLALLTGLMIAGAARAIAFSWFGSGWAQRLTPGLLALALFGLPLRQALREGNRYHIIYPSENYPLMIAEARRQFTPFPQAIIVQNGLQRPLDFYLARYEEEGLKLSRRRFALPVTSGEVLIACEDTTLSRIPPERIDTLFTHNGCVMVKVR